MTAAALVLLTLAPTADRPPDPRALVLVAMCVSRVAGPGAENPVPAAVRSAPPPRPMPAVEPPVLVRATDGTWLWKQGDRYTLVGPGCPGGTCPPARGGVR